MDEVRRNDLYKHTNLSIEISWLGSVQEKIRQLCPDPSPGISLVEGVLKTPNHQIATTGKSVTKYWILNFLLMSTLIAKKVALWKMREFPDLLRCQLILLMIKLT